MGKVFKQIKLPKLQFSHLQKGIIVVSTSLGYYEE